MSYRDPKQNSLIGEFQGKEGRSQRHSADVLEAIPVAIEGFTAKNVGANTIELESPQIINATNIDTETLLGNIGLKKIVTGLSAQTLPSIRKTITERGISGLPGDDYRYSARQYLLITSAFNDDFDINHGRYGQQKDVYSGNGFVVPSLMDVVFDSKVNFFVPIISTPAFVANIYDMTVMNNGAYGRAFVIFSFVVATIFQGSPPPIVKSIVLGKDNLTLYPVLIENTHEYIKHASEGVTILETATDGDIAANFDSNTYESTFQIKVNAPANVPVYYKTAPLTDPITALSFDEDDMGNVFNGFLPKFYIRRPMSIRFAYVSDNGIVMSEQYNYNLDVEDYEPITTPTVSINGSNELVIVRNDSANNDAIAVYTLNGTVPMLDVVPDDTDEIDGAFVYDNDNKPVIPDNSIVVVQILSRRGAKYYDSEPVTIAHNVSVLPPTPIITPATLVFKQGQKIDIRIDYLGTNTGKYSVVYKWFKATDTVTAEDVDETWSTVVQPAPSPVILKDIVIDPETPQLVVVFSKGSEASIASATYTLEEISLNVTSPTLIDKLSSYLDDGFDSNTVRRAVPAVELFPVNDEAKITMSIYPLTEQVTDDSLESDPAKVFYKYLAFGVEYQKPLNSVPLASQTLLVTPLYESRNLTKMHTVSIGSHPRGALTLPTEKRSVPLYSDSYCTLLLNTYYDATEELYRHCFSVASHMNKTITYPNVFSSPETESDDVVVDRIVCVREHDVGAALFVVSYSIAGIKLYAYLSLFDSNSKYPTLSGLPPSYALSETITTASTAVVKHKVWSSLPMSFIADTEQIVIAPGEDQYSPLQAKLSKMFYKSPRQAVKHIQYDIPSGNELALATNKVSPTTLSSGQHLYFSTRAHADNGVLAWKDGLERFSPIIPLPVMFPYKMLFPIPGRRLVRYRIPNDGVAPSSHVSYLSLPTSWLLEIANFFFETVSALPVVSGVGTLFVLAPPAILEGGAYDEVQSTEEALDINFIGTELVYGDKAEQGILITDKGAYNSSYWPYMSDSTRRVSELGPYKQVTVLENYIFTEQDGNSCVYYVDDERGKNLVFNKPGKFAHTPLVYSGVPLFVINQGTISRLYKGTEEGVLPIREEESSESFLLAREGTSPAWYVKKGSEYTIYNIDANSVSSVGKITANSVHVTEIVAPGRKTHRLTATIQGQEKELIPSQTTASEYKIESNDIYPSGLSYDYEKYTFIVNALVMRFKIPTGASNHTAKVRVWSERDRLILGTQNAPYEITLDKPEVIIPLDIQPVSSLRYELSASIPLRGIRFLGHFIETLKGEQ